MPSPQFYAGYHLDEPSEAQRLNLYSEGRGTVYDSLGNAVFLEPDGQGDCILPNIPRADSRNTERLAVWVAFYQPLISVEVARAFLCATADGLTPNSPSEFETPDHLAKINNTPGTDIALLQSLLRKISLGLHW
ncbi:MAG TPA: hypothetical protein VJX69_13385 [Terriglobales bacterium]|nr:hypothetical protein [Terriglobales bacterium]